jgi:hypothetical protein
MHSRRPTRTCGWYDLPLSCPCLLNSALQVTLALAKAKCCSPWRIWPLEECTCSFSQPPLTVYRLRCRYVCGSYTSSTGLTVSLLKESGTGDYSLEAGALVRTTFLPVEPTVCHEYRCLVIKESAASMSSTR